MTHSANPDEIAAATAYEELYVPALFREWAPRLCEAAGMLSVAAQHAPDIEWREGVAEALPYEDASFDAVVSQFGLMYFPDRVGAIREMLRVLAPGGRIFVAGSP